MVRSFSKILLLGILAGGLPVAPVLAQEAAGLSLQLAQNGGASLSEAVEQVKRQTDGRIISAETKIRNGREVHHIKVLTKDGKVKTVKIRGRSRGNG